MLIVVIGATGALLMTSFAPSVQSAWASIHYIERNPFGHFVRGLHYWASQLVVVLFAVYMLKELVTAKYKAPREFVWFTGLVLLPLLVVWTLTGSLVTGTETARGQIEVETNIVSTLPLIGPALQRIILGGSDIGQIANTHFYFLHVALLPVVVVFLLLAHTWQIRRASQAIALGSVNKNSDENDKTYFPNQSARNLFVFAIFLAAVSHAAWHYGAPLEMPAGSGIKGNARPEWYFTFLFELRHILSGPMEAVSITAVLVAMFGLLFIMPWLESKFPKFVARLLRWTLALVCVLGWFGMTYLSLHRDSLDTAFVDSKKQEHALSERAWELATLNSVPPEGARSLLRNDPKVQGPILFEKHCASCHSHTPIDKAASKEMLANENFWIQRNHIAAEEPSAPNLYNYATRDWVAGMLDLEQFKSTHYFGGTAFADSPDGMVEWLQTNIVDLREELVDDEDTEGLEELQTDLHNVVLALSAEAELLSQKELDKKDAEQITLGKENMVEIFNCKECHRVEEKQKLARAVDLVGYGSREWTIDFIADASHKRFYGKKNDRMPAYAAESEENPKLTKKEITLITDWLRGEWSKEKSKAGR